MKIQDITQLMECFAQSPLSELELKLEGAKLKLKKEGKVVEAGKEAAGNNQSKNIQMNPSYDNGSEEIIEETKTGTVVEAPLMGTFYAAPSPEKDPFVNEGSRVKKGDVIGIIEAMKMMNEIVAPCDGTIEGIEVENGQMVEFHQVLMRIG